MTTKRKPTLPRPSLAEYAIVLLKVGDHPSESATLDTETLIELNAETLVERIAQRVVAILKDTARG